MNMWNSLLAAASLLAAQSVLGGSITESPHDFRGMGWNGGRICVFCHTPLEFDAASPGAMWSDRGAPSPYKLYNSPSVEATRLSPSGNSKVCLSCHDGAIATDRSSGATGSSLIPAAKNVENTLLNHHPVGFLYDREMTSSSGGLFDPGARTVTVGTGEQSRTGTITSTLLFDGRMECSSCHDVHNTFTVGTKRLVKSAIDGRTICLACHDK